MARTYFKDSHNRIIPRVALRWIVQGKRKQGRPKATWRRTVEKEIKAMLLTSGARLKWSQWTELVGGREWMPHCSARCLEQEEEEELLLP